MKIGKARDRDVEGYATVYDVFYRNKDYRKESAYALDLIREHLGREPRTLLDLGCGTGGHALCWAARGIAVTGIDRSKKMLEQANQKARSKRLKITFLESDIRQFAVKKKFD